MNFWFCVLVKTGDKKTWVSYGGEIKIKFFYYHHEMSMKSKNGCWHWIPSTVMGKKRNLVVTINYSPLHLFPLNLLLISMMDHLKAATKEEMLLLTITSLPPTASVTSTVDSSPFSSPPLLVHNRWQIVFNSLTPRKYETPFNLLG